MTVIFAVVVKSVRTRLGNCGGKGVEEIDYETDIPARATPSKLRFQEAIQLWLYVRYVSGEKKGTRGGQRKRTDRGGEGGATRGERKRKQNRGKERRANILKLFR